MQIRFASKPCSECPFRKDAPKGMFTKARFEALRQTIGNDDEMCDPYAPVFACHKSAEEKSIGCAGWLAKFGQFHLRIRLMLGMGDLDFNVWETPEDWPELYDDYDDVVRDKAG